VRRGLAARRPEFYFACFNSAISSSMSFGVPSCAPLTTFAAFDASY